MPTLTIQGCSRTMPACGSGSLLSSSNRKAAPVSVVTLRPHTINAVPTN
jgi:hypothetical protein